MTKRPTGRAAVIDALTTATVDLIVEKGVAVSVREIASRAGVNHGLVHTYFGSKHALIVAAVDRINQRAAEDIRDDGFPPADLANRRGGELGKAIARIRLDTHRDLFSSHPVSDRWGDAIARTQPDLPREEVESMVITASALGLGWAVFGDHLAELYELGDDRRASLDKHVASIVADLGGIPDQTDVDHPAPSAPAPGRPGTGPTDP